MAEQEIVVPDIGSDDAVDVIEINVNVGDSVEAEDPLITLESEKASMEIPSPRQFQTGLREPPARRVFYLF